MLILPDILLVILPFAVLAVDLFFNPRYGFKPAYRATWIGLTVVFIAQCLAPHNQTQVYVGAFRVAPWSLILKQIFVAAALLTTWLARPYFEPRLEHPRLTRGGEFFTTIAFCAVGMSVIVSSMDLITIFVGLELATLPLYVLTAFYRTEESSTEAAMKFIVMGSLSTALMLFGYSLFYGAVGKLDFASLATFTAAHPHDKLLFCGALFVLAAVGFKLAMAPFHMWAPDVYEGAPTPVAGLLSTGSKAAALGFMILVFCGPLDQLHGELEPNFAALAAISMLVGNLGALKQKNFRRFMAYSSTAQVGYILLAFLSNRAYTADVVIFYAAIYLVGNMAAFFVFSAVGRDRTEEFASLRGLSRSNPVLAAVLMLSMFSLAGVPPLAGFTGKFMLFAAAAEPGRYGLVLFAALNSVASLYYYMLVVKEAYIIEPETVLPPVKTSRTISGALAVCAVALLVLGIIPTLSKEILVSVASFAAQ